MSKFKGKAAGILNGLEDGEEEKSKKVNEDKNKRIKEEKSKEAKGDQTEETNESENEKEDEKLKRSYMLKKDTIRKLKMIEIERIDKTLSEIVEEAIIKHYKDVVKE